MPLRRIAVGITLVAMLTACSSAPAGSTPPGGTSAPGASATPPATAAPSATAPGTSQTPFPSFAGDSDLAAKFPTQVAGQPLTNLTTLKFVDFVRAFSTAAQIDTTRQTFAALGIDLDTVVFGSATATVNGSPVGIQAFRVPGQDAGKLIQNYALLSSNNEGDTLKQETSGGKSVSVVRSADGFASTWMYANGDILWLVSTSDQTEAAAVFSALP
jgi:hypothetical protein